MQDISSHEGLAMEELTLHVSVKGKELLDLSCQKYWFIGMGLLIVLAYLIYSLVFYRSKEVH